MKSIHLLLSALLFAGIFGLRAQAVSAQVMPEGVLSATVLDGSATYCHTKFPAIREETLSGNHPILKDGENNGDIIDFYGPCNHDPLGKDEIQAQRMQHSRDVYLGE